MNILDWLLVALALWAALRGFSIGLLRQAGSTLGLLGGMAGGSVVGSVIINHEQELQAKAIAGIIAVLVCGLIGMALGEQLGIHAKFSLRGKRIIDKFDGYLGSLMGVTTMLIGLWLLCAIAVLGLTGQPQQIIRGSRILAVMNSHLPPATKVFSTFDSLINPNHSPEVFSGLEPAPSNNINLPALGSFGPVVQNAETSVVMVSGTGCGGIVEGSGFIAAPGMVATNAHVVAGVQRPHVIDHDGTIHNTAVMWFDPEIDLAILRVSGLSGQPLTVDAAEHDPGTPGVVIGYPGGGGLNAQPAAIMNRFTAIGRDIYDQGRTERDVYSLQAHVIPGNSGGPLIGKNGQVLGIVFGTSTTYNNVGYALTGHQVAGELAEGEQSNHVYSTGACSE